MKLVIFGIVFVLALVGGTYVVAGGLVGDKDTMGKLAILGAVAIATIATFVVIKYVRQMQNDEASGELADENWDGIGEYKNELPKGWAIIFLGLNIWAIWYFLMGYPTNAYSQIGEYNEEVRIHNAAFEQTYKDLSDEELTEMGQSVFIVQCAPCHGLKADGMDGKAADLNHRISTQSVKYVINNGANNFKTDFPGGMPAGLNYMFADEAEIDAVVNYVVAGFPESDTKGAELFTKGTCNGCHGEKGEGMAYAGPKINHMSTAFVAEVLKDGKKGAIGVMPAFSNLTDIQTKAVASYITSLSE